MARKRRLPSSGSLVSNEEGRRLLADNEPEDSLLQFVRDAALANRWLFYHTYRSDRSDKGFYDVVAMHPTMMRIVLAELKSTRGGFTDEQKEWAAAAESIARAWAQTMAFRDPASPLATAVYPPHATQHNGMYAPARIETWPLAYFQWRPTKEDKDEIEKVFLWRR